MYTLLKKRKKEKEITHQQTSKNYSLHINCEQAREGERAQSIRNSIIVHTFFCLKHYSSQLDFLFCAQQNVPTQDDDEEEDEQEGEKNLT